jgi:CheY-like chemotaxis protein
VLMLISAEYLASQSVREEVRDLLEQREHRGLRLMSMSGGMNGLQLCRILRHDEPALRTLISSGYTTELSVRRDSSGGEIVHLPKPCSSEALIGAIQACLTGVR